MNQFSNISKSRLNTCDIRIQNLMIKVLRKTDITILCGHRGKYDQDQAIINGTSRSPWPTSKHNTKPSLAVDIAPYPIDWDDKERFIALSKIVLAEAAKIGYKIRWGGDWDGDGKFNEKFIDLPHYELIV